MCDARWICPPTADRHVSVHQGSKGFGIWKLEFEILGLGVQGLEFEKSG